VYRNGIDKFLQRPRVSVIFHKIAAFWVVSAVADVYIDYLLTSVIYIFIKTNKLWGMLERT
jgi:hypothetical protein